MCTTIAAFCSVPPARLTQAAAQALPRVLVSANEAGAVNKDLFGANLLWPYDAAGAFDPHSGTFYPTFVSMLEHFGISTLRYPGGTTADTFHWERAIGPAKDRRSNEPFGMQGPLLSKVCCVVNGPTPSVVGPDEFGRLLDQVGATGNIVVNFATGTVNEAAAFVAYMTAPQSAHPSHNPAQSSYWAALRARNGHPAPYPVRYWEVGNEQVFPGQYGWRSGTPVSLGPGHPYCSKQDLATCLYAYGGTTHFSSQPVGTFADTMPSASASTGQAHQVFYVYYPPVVPRSERVMVGGHAWRQVGNLSSVGPRVHAYTFSPLSGKITFGDGHHGAVPPRGAAITATYDSGPHGGFIEYYRAMKRMNPHIRVCESLETDVSFLKLMGKRHHYDCIELHEYAAPEDVALPLTRYEERLMAYPVKEGSHLVRFQQAVRRYSGRDVPVAVTEYGQLVWPMPRKAPEFLLSLDEALFIAAQLREWALHGVPLAEKYLLTSSPFLVNDPRRVSVDSVVRVLRTHEGRHGVYEWDPGLSIDSAMVAGPGPHFVAEPTAYVVGLMSRLAGGRLLSSSVRNGPVLPGTGGLPALLTLAARDKARLRLLVINTSPVRSVRATVVTPWHRSERFTSSSLNGPTPTAYNTAQYPLAVRVTSRTVRADTGDFSWTFPAHSLTLFDFEGRGASSRSPTSRGA